MPQPKTETERDKMLRETVFETCDRLARDGRKPTNRVVRDVLGGGSMSDIQPLVKTWRERRDAAALAAMAAPEAPPEFHDIWPAVWRLASRAHEAERRSWDEDRRDLETVPPPDRETPIWDYATMGSASIWSRLNWAGER